MSSFLIIVNYFINSIFQKNLFEHIPTVYMLWGNMLWDQAITRVGTNKTEAFGVAGQKCMSFNFDLFIISLIASLIIIIC